jgi:hypothetical protein
LVKLTFNRCCRIWFISTSSVFIPLYPESKLLANAFAVSIEVRQGIPRVQAFLRILVLSAAGSLPFSEVEMI